MNAVLAEQLAEDGEREDAAALRSDRGEHGDPPRRTEHAGLQHADAVADQAVREREEAKRRAVHGRSRGRPATNPTIAPRSEPPSDAGRDRQQHDDVAPHTEDR